MHALLLQLCPTLCDPMVARLLCLWDVPGKNTGVGCHALLQDLPDPRIKSKSHASLALQADSLPLSYLSGKP